MIRNIVVVQSGRTNWVLNAGNTAIGQLQFSVSKQADMTFESDNVTLRDGRLVIHELPAGAAVRFQSDEAIKFRKCVFVKLLPGRSTCITVPAGRLTLSVQTPATAASSPRDLVVSLQPPADGFAAASCIPMKEEYRMLMDQLRIVLREILFKGRSFDSNKYLDTSKTIPLEHHDNW